MNTLYLCDGKRPCNCSPNCYMNGGECKHTLLEANAATPKNERRFRTETRLINGSVELTLIELDSKNFFTV